jgi:hypothetical protein
LVALAPFVYAPSWPEAEQIYFRYRAKIVTLGLAISGQVNCSVPGVLEKVRMDWGAVEAIAEVVGLLLVVISLLFVGFQLKQNTQQLRQDNLLKSIRGTLDTNWSYHRDPETFRVMRHGCKDFEALSPKDQALFHSIAMDLSFYLELVIRMSQAGLIDEEAWRINERFFLGLLATPGGAKWWETVKHTRPMPESAIQYLQSLLDNPGHEKIPLTELQPWLSDPD